jgi:hypothetical protein
VKTEIVKHTSVHLLIVAFQQFQDMHQMSETALLTRIIRFWIWLGLWRQQYIGFLLYRRNEGVKDSGHRHLGGIARPETHLGLIEPDYSSRIELCDWKNPSFFEDESRRSLIHELSHSMVCFGSLLTSSRPGSIQVHTIQLGVIRPTAAAITTSQDQRATARKRTLAELTFDI